MLDLVEQHLKSRRITYTSITGKVCTEDRSVRRSLIMIRKMHPLRQRRVDNFNKVNSDPRVMLLSLTAGGVGLVKNAFIFYNYHNFLI